jgi:hypothetical protein
VRVDLKAGPSYLLGISDDKRPLFGQEEPFLLPEARSLAEVVDAAGVDGSAGAPRATCTHTCGKAEGHTPTKLDDSSSVCTRTMFSQTPHRPSSTIVARTLQQKIIQPHGRVQAFRNEYFVVDVVWGPMNMPRSCGFAELLRCHLSGHLSVPPLPNEGLLSVESSGHRGTLHGLRRRLS